MCILLPGTVMKAAEQSRYDPSICKTDAYWKIYIALGRNVLALPTTTPVVVRSELYPGFNRIQSPDPSDAEGCPNNPLQLTGYAFPYAAPSALLGGEKTAPDQMIGTEMLQLIRTLDGDAVPTDHDAVWTGEQLQLGLAPRICAKAKIQEDLPDG